MNRKGSVMVMTLATMLFLVSLAGAFLFAAGTFALHSGWEETDAKIFWLAEAGLQKAIWNLMTPAGSGGQGETWTTAGTTENFGDGSYTMGVSRYDFALASNGSSASDNPAQGNSSIGPAKAIDRNDSTYWESAGEPKNNSPQDMIIAFPYALNINKVRFLAPSSATRPRDYTWAVSTDGGTNYTTVVTVNNNAATNVTNTFSVQTGVTHVRLRTTRDGQGNPKNVRVSTLEAIGSKITSTGTVTTGGNTYTRQVQQTVAADDASPQNQVAYYESDWQEN